MVMPAKGNWSYQFEVNSPGPFYFTVFDITNVMTPTNDSALEVSLSDFSDP
jgi:hypothetical protein